MFDRKEYMRAYLKEYAKRYNKENREMLNEKLKKWRAKNPEKIAGYNRRQNEVKRKEYAIFPDLRLQKSKEWRRANPEKVKQMVRLTVRL